MGSSRPLVLVSTSFPPNVVGGAEVNAELLATQAMQAGWDVTVLTGAAVLPRQTVYQIHSLPALRPRPSIVYEPWWNRRTAEKISARIPPGAIVHSFDVLSRGVLAELVSSRSDLATITTLQDISLICGSIDGLLDDGTLCHGDTPETILRHSRIKRFDRAGQLARYIRYYTACVTGYRKSLLERYDTVTVLSNFLARYLELEHVQVLPDLLVPPTQACKLERTSAPTILAVGRLDFDKGTDLLLDALTHLPDFLLTLVGSGDNSYWRREIAKRNLAGRVTIVGPVPIHDVGSWYHAADVVALASRAPEASSRSLLEAMSCGRAVVGPNFGGPAELVTEGSTGRLFARGDARSLAAAIRQAYAERLSLGRRGLEAARQYHPDRVGPKYLRLYEALET